MVEEVNKANKEIRLPPFSSLENIYQNNKRLHLGQDFNPGIPSEYCNPENNLVFTQNLPQLSYIPRAYFVQPAYAEKRAIFNGYSQEPKVAAELIEMPVRTTFGYNYFSNSMTENFDIRLANNAIHPMHSSYMSRMNTVSSSVGISHMNDQIEQMASAAERTEKLNNFLENNLNSTHFKKTCLRCSTTNTPEWRRGPSGTVLCNACGLYHAKLVKRKGTITAAQEVLNKKVHRNKNGRRISLKDGSSGYSQTLILSNTK